MRKISGTVLSEDASSRFQLGKTKNSLSNMRRKLNKIKEKPQRSLHHCIFDQSD